MRYQPTNDHPDFFQWWHNDRIIIAMETVVCGVCGCKELKCNSAYWAMDEGPVKSDYRWLCNICDILENDRRDAIERMLHR